jgi:hypothetical protein
LEKLNEQLTESSTRLFKIPKVIPLATLLDSHSRGRDLGAANEPDMDHEESLRTRRKKRRGLRM